MKAARCLLAMVMLAVWALGLPSHALAACSSTAGADCSLRSRIAAADSFLQSRPGIVGYVLRDRVTGLRYANVDADKLIWTASTIKLAMVVDLLVREQTRAISLSETDRRLMVKMLRDSDNAAADTLWTRYGGDDHQAFNANFPRYGMTDLRPQPGFGAIYPYWGFQKSTTNDLDKVMNYALAQLNPTNSAAVVVEMQRVSGDQQWGVWGAGPAMAPGNKNGWSEEQGGWVVNSVGFAGPSQRYTLAIMNSLGGEGGYDDGVATTTKLSEILLGP